MPANFENSAVATGLEKVSFHSNPKERQCQECSNYCRIVLISHSSKVIFKILQVRLQQYMNQGLPDVQAGFRKGSESEIKLPTSIGSLKKQENSRKTSTFALLIMLKPLIVWITTNCGKFLKKWEYQTTLRAFWETCMQVKKQQLEPDMEQQTGSKLGKGVCQGCILLHCSFNLYAEYIMQNAGLDEAQAGIKTVGRNINNLRYGRKWKGTKEPLDEGERGEWKSWLRTQDLKKEDHGIWSHHFMQIDAETIKTVTDFIFWSPKSLQMVPVAMKFKNACSL